MRLMIDTNVIHGVGTMLRSRGHTVEFVNVLFAPGMPDSDIDSFARLQGWIIVSHDQEFMRKIQQPRFNFELSVASGYGRIMLTGKESAQLDRFRDTVELIESYHQWALRTNHRLVVTIGPTWIRFDDQPRNQTARLGAA